MRRRVDYLMLNSAATGAWSESLIRRPFGPSDSRSESGSACAASIVSSPVQSR